MDCEQLRAYRNDRNSYGNRMGIYVEEIRPGYARAVKTLTEEDLNPVRVPHGGVYFSLADTACGAAAAVSGMACVTINCSFSFLKSAETGQLLIAEAREISGGKSIFVLEARVCGKDGELYALGTFTFRRTKQPLEEYII